MPVDRPRVVFLGTPQFAVPSLLALGEVAHVVGVVCQPDKPSGRGLEVTAPAVKQAALARGLTVHQPAKMKDGTFAAWLRAHEADLAVVVAYGRILPPDVLAAPRLGCLNVHASILPRHRGAAPVQWAVLAGDRTTGATLMQMDAGLDTGATLAVRETPIGPDETGAELAVRLSQLGAALLRDELANVVSGALVPVPQDDARATFAPPLTKEMGTLDFRQSARRIHDRVRALQPWPGASTTLGARRLMVHGTSLAGAPQLLAGAPGEVVAVTRDRVWVATGDGAVAVTEVQLEGRKRMGVGDFLAGHPVRPGTFLGA